MWKLCEFAREQQTPPLEELRVVFISNADRTVRGRAAAGKDRDSGRRTALNPLLLHQVPLWRQKSGCGDQPVVWVGAGDVAVLF